VKNKQERVLQALRRVLNFGGTNPTIIPPATGSSDTWSILTRAYGEIITIVAQVTDAAAEQGRQTINATLAATSEPSLRSALKLEMRGITQVAQSLKKTVPGIGILKMPKATVTAEALLKYATTMMKQATTYQPVLVDHLGPDFIGQLSGAITAYKTSVDSRGTARTTRVAATRALADGLTLGLQFVSRMDVLLTKSLQSNQPKLAEWKNAKRVTSKGVISTNTSTPTTTAPAAAAPSAAATPEATATAA
jgi:hypothetical protein